LNNIFCCRKILTISPSKPVTTHVAVRNGRIVDVGTLNELASLGDYSLDTRFADKILMPGLVEAHSHVMQGAFWKRIYCGYFDRMDPEGRVWPGLTTIDNLLVRLSKADREFEDRTKPLAGWGFDPLYWGSERLQRRHLDQVSTSRPIGILHASCHILNVNTKTLKMAGLLRSGLKHPGLPLGEDGLPEGELRGHECMALANRHVGFMREELANDEFGFRQFAKQCVRTGVTTATDLAAVLPDDAVKMMLRVTAEQDFPVRIAAMRKFINLTGPDLIRVARELGDLSTDGLRLGSIKVVADGSIQGFTARLCAPGYFNGAPNGIWYMPREHIEEVSRLALKENVQMHVHTNGDQATQLVLECIQKSLKKHAWSDHRFTMQHCQLASRNQLKKMRELGLCANLFSNQIFFWGDLHCKYTVGPKRARNMNACRSALDIGVPTAIHSDAPITPLSPLFTAWCAVNRLTHSGQVLGKHECITIDEALYAITMGAAYTLKLDSEIGSIEKGKRADFAILEQDPTEVDIKNLKDIEVWGTVQDGRVFPASEQ